VVWRRGKGRVRDRRGARAGVLMERIEWVRRALEKRVGTLERSGSKWVGAGGERGLGQDLGQGVVDFIKEPEVT
jgi:hypothetical protein